jgi:hypothetical protein
MRTIGKTFHRRINVLLGEMRGNATEILNFEKRPSSKLATDALKIITSTTRDLKQNKTNEEKHSRSRTVER